MDGCPGCALPNSRGTAVMLCDQDLLQLGTLLDREKCIILNRQSLDSPRDGFSRLQMIMFLRVAFQDHHSLSSPSFSCISLARFQPQASKIHSRDHHILARYTLSISELCNAQLTACSGINKSHIHHPPSPQAGTSWPGNIFSAADWVMSLTKPLIQLSLF